MRDLTQGNELKTILYFALPMLVGNIFQQLYNIVDSIIVGNFLGKEALSAVGASFPIFFLLISLIIGIASGNAIVIAQYFGAKNYNMVNRAIDTMVIILFSASIVVSVAGILLIDFIFKWIDLPQEIIPQAKTYLIIIFIGLVAAFGFNGINAILRGLGDSRTPLYFLILSTFLNIGLDLLFVMVFHWGIAGAAWATVFAQLVATIAAIIYLNKTHQIIRFSVIHIVFDKEVFLKSMKIGLPSGLQQMFVALGMTAMFGIVNKFGTNVIAAYSVAGRIDSFAMLPAMNFSQALTTFVGQNIGAGKIERVKKGLMATLSMTTVISLVFSLIAIFAGTFLMKAFTPEAQVIRMGAQYLTVVGMFYILFSAMFSVTAVFRGAGDTIVPMFITLFALWAIRIPLAYLFSDKYGYIGIWWSIPAAWGVGMVLSLLYYYMGRWKKIKITKK